MSRISSPIFVGRVAELAALERAWSDVRAGSGRLCLIYGEAGIGKSRLVEEFAGRVSVAGGRLHQGRCLDVGDGMLPFGPIAEVIRSLVAERGFKADTQPTSAAAEAIAAFQPGRSSRAGRRHVDDPLTGQGRLFAGVAEVLAHAAVDLPRVVVIEDAHWLDPASRDMVRFLAHVLRDASVLLLVTVRDDMGRVDPTARMLTDMEREPHAARLDLPRFTTNEVAAQLLGILNSEPLEDLVRSVHARSGGNPFFTEEVLALDIHTGSSIPPSLRDMLLSHLTSAGAVERRLLDAAAVGGRWVSDDRLRDVVGLDPPMFLAALHALGQSQFLVADDRPEGTGLSFRHALVRDAVYDDLLPAERRTWHAAWAEVGAVESSGSAAIADHLALAGLTGRAALAYVAAGEAADQAHAYAEAVRLYERAMELLPADREGTVDEASLLERLALAAEACGQRDRAVAALRSAVELPVVQELPMLAGRLYRQLAELAMFAGLDDVAFEALTRGQQALASTPDDPENGRLLANHAMLLLLCGRLDEAGRALDIAARVTPNVEDPIAHARTAHVRAVLIGIDNPAVGVEALELAEFLAKATGQLGIQLQARLDQARMLITLGRFEAALAAVDGVRKLAQTNGAESWVFAACAMYAVECLSALGRWPEIDPLVESVERSEQGSFARIAIALHLLDRGKPAEARRLAEDGLRGIPEGTQDAACRRARAQGEIAIAEADGDSASVLAAADRAGDLDSEEDLGADLAMRGIKAGALLLRCSTEVPQVQAVTNRLRQRLQRVADRPGHADSRSIQACHLTAEAELASIDRRDPVLAWEAAGAAWRDIDWRYRFAYCRYREAEARLVAGRDRRLADAGLRDAYSIAAELGAHPLIAEIELLARRARVALSAEPRRTVASEPMSTPTPADPHGLTEREHEVLRLLISGRTNREIGAMLFISPKTAGVHVSNILGKFGASNRVEAASIAHRLGMADLDPLVAIRI